LFALCSKSSPVALSKEKGEEEEFSAYTKDFSIFLPSEAKKNHNQRAHQNRLQIKKLVRK